MKAIGRRLNLKFRKVYKWFWDRKQELKQALGTTREAQALDPIHRQESANRFEEAKTQNNNLTSTLKEARKLSQARL
jgi:hypothetical protein